MGLYRYNGRRGASATATQIQVGLFTVLAVIAAFVVVVVVSDIGTRARGYPIAVHFKDVAGLQEGASVQVSGVVVGDVSRIRLLPDQTVLAEAFINKGTPIYRQSKFIVASTLTGQSTLVIRPPGDLAKATVLPPWRASEDPNDAPWGIVPATIADLVSEGEERLKSLDTSIAVINIELPKIVHKFDNIATHTDTLITSTGANMTTLTTQLNATVAELDIVLKKSGHNIVELTGNMNSLVANNQQQVQQLIDSLSDTAKNLNSTMANFASITGDPTIKASLVQTAVNFKDASEKLKMAASDLQGLTGDPKLQGELRSTISELNDVSAKADDILGNFSSASGGVANGAAVPPAPTASGAPAPGNAVPGAAVPGAAAPPTARPAAPQGTPAPHASFHGGGLSNLKLVGGDVRLSWTNKPGGPSSDFNVTVLPNSPTNLTVGASDLGYNTTYNFLIGRRLAPGLTVSGGVLYSNLGLKTVYMPGPVGIDVRLYNSKNPALNLYGDVRLTKQLQLFYGEKNVFGPATKTPQFGLQANF